MTDMYMNMEKTEDISVYNGYHLPDAIIHTKFMMLSAMVNGMPFIPVYANLYYVSSAELWSSLTFFSEKDELQQVMTTAESFLMAGTTMILTVHPSLNVAAHDAINQMQYYSAHITVVQYFSVNFNVKPYNCGHIYMLLVSSHPVTDVCLLAFTLSCPLT
jgi:hypothetical protein